MKFNAASCVLSIVPAFVVVVLLMPLGCAGAAESGVPASSPTYFPPSSELLPSSTEILGPAPAESLVPKSTASQLRDCLKQNAHELTTYSHKIRARVGVIASGEVNQVKLEYSTLRSPSMEVCMTHALATMRLPPTAIPLGSSQQTRSSRESLGITQAAGALVALGPFVIMAAGVTLTVYVSAVAVAAAVEEAEEIEKQCMSALVGCLENPWQPKERRRDWGPKKDCGACYRKCKKEYGIWDEDKCPRP